MKTRTDKLQAAKVLTEQELRNVVGGIRKPTQRLGDPGNGGNGASGDIHADPWDRKG